VRATDTPIFPKSVARAQLPICWQRKKVMVIAPSQVIYRETFQVPCAHKECKIKVIVVVERIKGGGTSSIEVKHEH